MGSNICIVLFQREMSVAEDAAVEVKKMENLELSDNTENKEPVGADTDASAAAKKKNKKKKKKTVDEGVAEEKTDVEKEVLAPVDNNKEEESTLVRYLILGCADSIFSRSLVMIHHSVGCSITSIWILTRPVRIWVTGSVTINTVSETVKLVFIPPIHSRLRTEKRDLPGWAARETRG